jgi:NAD+ synthase (glutamine-hydrolysing)
MINIAASPFHYYHSEERKKIIRANCRKYKLPVIYVNHVGAQTELIFDGGSIIAGANENLIYECDYFKEQFLVIDTSELETPAVKNASDNSFINIKEIVPPQLQKFNPEKTFDALVLGIKDYFFKQNFSKAILGLSGGIDSAIVLCIAIKALGKENVMSVLMPSRYSSENSVNDALELLKNTKSPHENIPIEKIHTATELTLQGNFANTASGLAEENIQARIRAVLLMALSNKFGYILLNTSNKSETAVGYGTLYGDMCGGISPLGDVYKTQAYALAEYINRGEKIIPKAIIEKAPSAELKPSQKDSDSLPEYDILDPVLYKYIEENLSPDEIIKQGYSAPLVQRVLKLVNTNEYKRYQTPPILRVSPKAFGMGRRMPIVGKYLS